MQPQKARVVKSSEKKDETLTQLERLIEDAPTGVFSLSVSVRANRLARPMTKTIARNLFKASDGQIFPVGYTGFLNVARSLEMTVETDSREWVPGELAYELHEVLLESVKKLCKEQYDEFKWYPSALKSGQQTRPEKSVLYSLNDYSGIFPRASFWTEFWDEDGDHIILRREPDHLWQPPVDYTLKEGEEWVDMAGAVYDYNRGWCPPNMNKVGENWAYRVVLRQTPSWAKPCAALQYSVDGKVYPTLNDPEPLSAEKATARWRRLNRDVHAITPAIMRGVRRTVRRVGGNEILVLPHPVEGDNRVAVVGGDGRLYKPAFDNDDPETIQIKPAKGFLESLGEIAVRCGVQNRKDWELAHLYTISDAEKIAELGKDRPGLDPVYAGILDAAYDAAYAAWGVRRKGKGIRVQSFVDAIYRAANAAWEKSKTQNTVTVPDFAELRAEILKIKEDFQRAVISQQQAETEPTSTIEGEIEQ